MIEYLPKALKDYLTKRSLNFEDLTNEEKDTFLAWQKILEQKPLTIDEQINSLAEMIDTLILELVKIRTNDQNDTFLKARIENYLTIKSALCKNEKDKRKLNQLLER
jgi:hypothetical protein